MSKLPIIPIPKAAREEELRKAIWDYLRTGLSFDQANSVKPQAESSIKALLDGMIQRAKDADREEAA